MSFLMQDKRKATRGPINPLDKATVVSILPKVIREVKPTIQPGVFELAAGSYSKPSILLVGPSSWWREIDEEQPLVEIPTSSVSIAESIVVDYCNGLLGCDMGENKPGLFWVPGGFSLKEILEKHKPMLDEANRKQRNWFSTLVQMADTLWVRTSGNPISISEDMRMAARELGIENKDWLKHSQQMDLIRCGACGTMIRGDIIVCPNCKVILKPEEFKKLNMSFAS